MLTCSVSTASVGTKLRPVLDWAAHERAEMIELDGRRQVNAAELGNTARRQIRHLLSERSIRLSGLLFPLRGSIADVDRLADRVDLACQTMQLGHDLGAQDLIVPFRMPTDDTEHERTLDVVANLARHGERVGCRLTLRSGERPSTLGPFLRAASAAAPIGIQFDPAVCILTGASVEESMSGLADHIRQIRVCDVIRSSGSLGRETMIGRGEVDFDLIAAIAQQIDVQAAVVSPDDAGVAPLSDGLAYARAVFEGFGS